MFQFSSLLQLIGRHKEQQLAAQRCDEHMTLHGITLLHSTPGSPHKEFLAPQDWEGQHQADVPRAGAAFQLRLRSSVALGWRVMGPGQAGYRASVFSLIKVTLVTR